MSTIATHPAEAQRSFHWLKLACVPVALSCFSILYFVDVFLRASQKYFWYDELFTVYLCRLPGLGAVWSALLHGADFNPPFFYAITRAFEAIFGEGRVKVRLPEMIGFWILSLCLFRFVQRRAGTNAGLVAMLFPSLTGTFYYAFEARPYGIVLGFCGLSLICWQMAIEGREGRSKWVAGYCLFLLGAFLTHCYALTLAVPFGIAELTRLFRIKRIDWPMWLGLIGSSVIAALSYVPLLAAFRGVSSGTVFLAIFPSSWDQIRGFYLFLLAPSIVILLAISMLLAVEKWCICRVPMDGGPEDRSYRFAETALSISLALLPVIGVLSGRLVHGPFFARYFVSAVAGFAILVGFAAGRSNGSRNRLSSIILVLVVCTCLLRFSGLVSKRMHGVADVIEEPSTRLSLNMTLGGPLALHGLLTDAAGKSSLPIAVMEPQDFLYLVNYAPQLAPRLYFLGPSKDDIFYRGFRILQSWSPVKYNLTVTYSEFSAQYPDFLMYGASQQWALTDLGSKCGREIDKFWIANNRFLAELRRKS